MISLFKDRLCEYLPLSAEEILEINGYFDLIENLDERLKLQDMVISALQNSTVLEKMALKPRISCLHTTLKLMGLNVRTSKQAKDCNKLFCRRVFEFYRDLGYKKFSVTNRFFMYDIGLIDESIIDGVRAYFCSGYTADNVIGNFHRSADYNVFSEKVNGLAEIFPGEDRNRLAEYALYYTENKVALRACNELFFSEVTKLISVGLSFFDVSDQVLSACKKVNISDFKKYVDSLTNLRIAYGDEIKTLIEKGSLSYIDMCIMSHGIKNDIKLPLLTYLDRPLLSREYILWRSNKLPIEYYVAMGYRKVSQLEIIRNVILKGFDIRNFRISPKMSSSSMKCLFMKSGVSFDEVNSCIC